MNSLCVFCGTRPGQGDEYLEAARHFGRMLAQRKITLVYGGASVGMAGALANAVLRDGGEAIGVIPRGLWDREAGHRKLSNLFLVETLPQRMSKMAELADAFVILPGGLGTMEGFFETWTRGQLGLHRKPLGVLDVGGYFGGLFQFLDTMVQQGFVQADHRRMVRVAQHPLTLLHALDALLGLEGEDPARLARA